MEVLGLLIPVALLLGGIGLVAFFWAVRSDQFDDPDGDARRILDDRFDDAPKGDAPQQDTRKDDGGGLSPARASRRARRGRRGGGR